MQLDSSDFHSRQRFLKAAVSACWFNGTFDFRAVAGWCQMDETQAEQLMHQLETQGLVQIAADGTAAITDRGRWISKMAA